MKVITWYKQKPNTLGFDITQDFVDELNDFYCRCDKKFTVENDVITLRLRQMLKVLQSFGMGSSIWFK